MKLLSIMLLVLLMSTLVVVYGQSNINNSTVVGIHVDELVEYYLGDPSDRLSKEAKISTPLDERCVGTQKSWTTASILSLILGGLGIDRLYIGHVGIGLLKLFLGLALFGFSIFRCCFTFAFDTQKFNRKNSMMWLSFVSLVTIFSFVQFLLWIIDLVRIMTNSVLDGNNCPLSYSS